MNLLKVSTYTIILTFLTQSLFSQKVHNGGLIFGKVFTKSGQEYTGFLRWGKEEMYWHDIFNSNKVEDKSLFQAETAKQENEGFDMNWSFGSIWSDHYKTSSHIFSCYFGDIAELEMGKYDKVYLKFKNGQILKLNGGSNDIGSTIVIEDYELGKVKLKWSKIEKIVFMDSPPEMSSPYDQPLYGTVKTKRKGFFEGFIKWDLDERHGDDELDGDTDDGDKSIPFRNIVSITKHKHGADVELRSGRTLFLDNSNDVDNGNRGIEVFNPEIGSVKIDWKEFKHVDFVKAPNSGPSYSSFKKPNGLFAEVLTYDDQAYSGIIIFDIDEMWEPEMLDGEDDRIEYQIPFWNIKAVYPKNSEYSMVELKSGEKLLLGETQDVSDSNDGIMILTRDSKKPVIIDWDEIMELRFR